MKSMMKSLLCGVLCLSVTNLVMATEKKLPPKGGVNMPTEKKVTKPQPKKEGSQKKETNKKETSKNDSKKKPKTNNDYVTGYTEGYVDGHFSSHHNNYYNGYNSYGYPYGYNDDYTDDSYVAVTCSPDLVESNVSKTDKVIKELIADKRFAKEEQFLGQAKGILGIKTDKTKLAAYFSLVGVESTQDIVYFIGAREEELDRYEMHLVSSTSLDPKLADIVVSKLVKSLRSN